MVKTAGSVKVVFDAAGAPWLVVGQSDGSYEAQRVMVIERTLFDRSWKATDYVKAGTPAERAAERVAVSEAIEAAVGLVDHHERENERTLVRRHKADHEDLEAVEDALDEAIEVLVDLLRVIGAGRVR